MKILRLYGTGDWDIYQRKELIDWLKKEFLTPLIFQILVLVWTALMTNLLKLVRNVQPGVLNCLK